MAKDDLQLQLGFVRVSKAAYDAIKEQNPGRDDIAPLLNVAASHYLTQWGLGGMLLTANQLKQMEDAAGPLDTPEALIKAVQKANNRDGAGYTATVSLDPVYWEQLKQVAEWRGATPEDVLNDVVNTVVSNSWYAAWEYGGKVERFTEKQWKRLQELTGKQNPTGADIDKLLEGALTAA